MPSARLQSQRTVQRPPPPIRAAALAIPMKSGVESLNAAMATGIVLYLWQSRQANED